MVVVKVAWSYMTNCEVRVPDWNLKNMLGVCIHAQHPDKREKWRWRDCIVDASLGQEDASLISLSLSLSLPLSDTCSLGQNFLKHQKIKKQLILIPLIGFSSGPLYARVLWQPSPTSLFRSLLISSLLAWPKIIPPILRHHFFSSPGFLYMSK